MSDDPPRDDPPPPSDDHPPSPPSSVGVWLTIGAAVAAALAIFTGLGIEEEFLRRMVRNFPISTAISIVLVIIGGSLAAVSALILLVMKNPLGQRGKWWTRALGIASAAFVTGGMISTLSTGVASLRSQDMPGLSFSAVKSESGEVSISAEATSRSLRSSEKILLRLYGIEQDDSNPDEHCIGGSWPDIKDQDGSKVMWWGESGPDQTGAASVSQSLVVDDKRFSLICAYAAIVNQPVEAWWFISVKPEKEHGDDPFFAWSLVDLRNLKHAPTETPAP